MQDYLFVKTYNFITRPIEVLCIEDMYLDDNSVHINKNDYKTLNEPKVVEIIRDNPNFDLRTKLLIVLDTKVNDKLLNGYCRISFNNYNKLRLARNDKVEITNRNKLFFNYRKTKYRVKSFLQQLYVLYIIALNGNSIKISDLYRQLFLHCTCKSYCLMFEIMDVAPFDLTIEKLLQSETIIIKIEREAIIKIVNPHLNLPHLLKQELELAFKCV